MVTKEVRLLEFLLVLEIKCQANWWDSGQESKSNSSVLKRNSSKPSKRMSLPWSSHLKLICYLKTVQTASFLISPQHQAFHFIGSLGSSLNILFCSDKRAPSSPCLIPRILNCPAVFYSLAIEYLFSTKFLVTCLTHILRDSLQRFYKWPPPVLHECWYFPFILNLVFFLLVLISSLCLRMLALLFSYTALNIALRFEGFAHHCPDFSPPQWLVAYKHCEYIYFFSCLQIQPHYLMFLKTEWHRLFICQ